MSHTLGPWRVCDVDWRMVLDGQGLIVADLRTRVHADAHLIAAAPNLLEALAACEEQLSKDYPGAIRDKYWPTIAPIIEQARAAIAKAKGEA